MIDKNMSEREKSCARLMAKMFNEGKGNPSREEFLTAFEDHADILLSYNDYRALLEMMEHYGVVASALHVLSAEGRYYTFTISPKAVQVVRELDEQEKQSQEPGDIVEQIKSKAKSSPAVAWVIVGFIVLTALVSLISNLINIGQNLGWIPKP